MKPSQDIKPITYMKTHSAELVKTITKSRKPMVITQNGEAKVIVQDVKSFERDQNTLFLLKLISQGVSDLEAGRLIDQENLFDRLQEKISRT